MSASLAGIAEPGLDPLQIAACAVWYGETVSQSGPVLFSGQKISRSHHPSGVRWIIDIQLSYRMEEIMPERGALRRQVTIGVGQRSSARRERREGGEVGGSRN